jgi:hypothetical protein
MVDILFTHVNSLTKDLYEFSHYDAATNEQNNQICIQRLEKEIKVHVRMSKEQENQIKSLENEVLKMKEEVLKQREVSRVVCSQR